jgi:hypothetical protein
VSPKKFLIGIKLYIFKGTVWYYNVYVCNV